MEEGHAGFSGYGAGEQGFARAGRADQQHALGDARAQSQEALREFQEFDHFFQLSLGFIHTGHVVEGYGRTIEGQHTGAAATEAHGLVVGALGLPHHQQYQPAKEYEGQEVDQDTKDAAQPAGALVLNLGCGRVCRVLAQDPGVGKQLDQVGVFADATGVLGGVSTPGNSRYDGEFFPVYDDSFNLAGTGLPITSVSESCSLLPRLGISV